jgi:hypothetical protein
MSARGNNSVQEITRDRCLDCGAAIEQNATRCSNCSSIIWVSRLGWAVVNILSCSAIGLLAWTPFGVLNNLLRRHTAPGMCQSCQPETWTLFFFSARVALSVVFLPLLLVTIAFLSRKIVARLFARSADHLPPGVRYSVSATIATFFFTIAWTSLHYRKETLIGIVPQVFFPAIFGILTYGLLKYGVAVRGAVANRIKLAPLNATAKWTISAALPLLLSFALPVGRHISLLPLKEQTIVIITTLVGFILLAPRNPGLSRIG